MTDATNLPGDSQPTPFAELRILLEQTAATAAENARAIAEMRVRESERAVKHDQEMADIRASQARTEKAVAEMRAANAERDARHDKEMADIREAISRLTAAQNRTNQDVSTLKGWGLELYCERNPQIFANELGMIREQIISKREVRHIAYEAEMAGAITSDQYSNLSRADLFIYARRKSDNRPFCLVVEASFRVDTEDVDRASERANILDIIINKYQPRHLNGQVIPIVAGTDITPGAWSKLGHFGVTYVPINNGNQLTNPPE